MKVTNPVDFETVDPEVLVYIGKLRKECARRRTENIQLREELAALRAGLDARAT